LAVGIAGETLAWGDGNQATFLEESMSDRDSRLGPFGLLDTETVERIGLPEAARRTAAHLEVRMTIPFKSDTEKAQAKEWLIQLRKMAGVK